MKKRLGKFRSIMTLILVFTAIVVCMSSCSKTEDVPSSSTSTSEATTTSSTEKEEIRVITYFAGSDAWAPVWKEVIGEYMTAHPEIVIVDESVPTSGTSDVFRPKMNADIAAGTPADRAPGRVPGPRAGAVRRRVPPAADPAAVRWRASAPCN